MHLEISIQNISLVLRCESHTKCKLKATNNCIKRTLRKVNNPCTHRYKHRCFLPGGSSTSPSLMFLSLKLDIRGLNPQSSITLPLGVANKILGQSKYRNGEHARIYSRTKYKKRKNKKKKKKEKNKRKKKKNNYFFQAEDGIRDYRVTGVQTCALPICSAAGRRTPRPRGGARRPRPCGSP